MKLRCFLASAFLCSAFAFGQKPEFEVASVKPNSSGQRDASGQSSFASGRFTFINWQMRGLIRMAYGVRREFITGPSWLDSDRFDIEAKAPPNTSESDARLMMRALLSDRFKLTVHEDQKMVPVFALVVGKMSPALIPAAGTGRPTCHPGQGVAGQVHVECANLTLQDLADLLPDLAPGYIDRPVVNMTNIQGSFDFKLDWAPAPPRTSSPAPPAEPVPDLAGGPTIFDTLKRRFGLELEDRKHPMPAIVVDHIERVPTEN